MSSACRGATKANCRRSMTLSNQLLVLADSLPRGPAPLATKKWPEGCMTWRRVGGSIKATEKWERSSRKRKGRPAPSGHDGRLPVNRYRARSSHTPGGLTTNGYGRIGRVVRKGARVGSQPAGFTLVAD